MTMDTDGLFSLAPPGAPAATPAGGDTAGFGRPAADAPLPVRMRPATLDELVGQEHLLAPGAPLRQLVTGASPMSVILWGPPGTGKTTIAHLVAHATDRKFVAMSALTAGVKDVRAVIDTLTAFTRVPQTAAATLQRCRVRMVDAEAGELFATYTRGQRVRALAGRIECRDGRWRIVALQLG